MLTKIALGLLAFSVLLIGGWIVYSLTYSRGTEEAPYTVVSTAPDYEIRRYPELLVAETAMPGTDREASAAAFWILASYIFGGNAGGEKIGMTAPVTVAAKGEAIPMTAPVLMGEAAKGPRTMAFVMPARYRLDTLPKPNDPRVAFRVLPARTVAAQRYTWYNSPGRFASKAADLTSALQRDKIAAVGTPYFAGYDAPFVIPFLMRNEVQIEIKP